MRTLADQFLIDGLRKEVTSLKAKLLRKEREVEGLKTIKKKYNNAIKAKSKYKRIAEKLKQELTGKRPKTRCQKALELIEQRENGADIKLADIAKNTGLAYSTIKGLSRDYKKAAKL